MIAETWNAGERPTISRNSSSGFPDLQTLKGPLTIAATPYNNTRGSRDSGTTSSSTVWSARSSLATGASTNTTAPSSAALTAASLPSGSWSESHKHHFPWSVDLPNPDLMDGRSNGLGLSQTTANNGGPSRRPLESATPSELGKRPSFANFGAEMEERRKAEAAAAEVQEAWRRQSDNAAVLSAERRRLMGSSVAKHASELELAIGVTLPPPTAKTPHGGDSKSSGADEALLAARTRLLRYESYPFGSKDAENVRLTAATDATDPYRRQSMFPEPVEGPWDANVVNLTQSPTAATTAMTQPSSPARNDVVDRRPYSSVSSQRDLQFEEIVRKASVDLVKRSATSSLTGTPVGAVRPLLLPHESHEHSPLPAGTLEAVSEAERANAREREQRRESLAFNLNKEAPGKARRVDVRLTTSEAPLSPQRIDSRVAVRAPESQLVRHSHQAMDVDNDFRPPDPLPANAPGRGHLETTLRSVGLSRIEGEEGLASARRDSLTARPRFNSGETSSGPLPTIPPFGHHHHTPARPHFQNFPQPMSARGSPSIRGAGQTPELVMPYYDNPTRASPGGGPDRNLDFPSVLRRDYQPVALDRPTHTYPSTLHVPPTALHPAHHNPQHIQPPSEQYGPPHLQHMQLPPEKYGPPPPQHFHGPWDGDPRMSHLPQPPAPNRMLSAPTVLGINNATLPGPRYTCEHCGKSFSRPSSLKIHIYSRESLHRRSCPEFISIFADTGEKPYKCTWPNCTRSFSVQSNLKRHAKVHLENSGQHSASGNNRLHLGEHHHTALSRVSEGEPTSVASSSTSYRGDFLTPQTGQPLPAGGTPEGYFDIRLHARHPASHSPGRPAR